MRVTQAADYVEPRDSLAQDWIATLTRWGMTPVPIPNGLAKPGDFVSVLGLDLIVLTGGDDPTAPDTRLATETALIEHALATTTPLFGVCRGTQVLNRHFGGRLTDISGHVATDHDIAVVDNRLSAIYGPTTKVNSYHGIGIPTDGVAEAFAIAATAGPSVEAIIHRTAKIAGVVWHPERKGAPDADRILFAKIMDGSLFA